MSISTTNAPIKTDPLRPDVRELLERLVRRAHGARGRHLYQEYEDAKKTLDQLCRHDRQQYETATGEFVRRCRL